jgi:hypothetical protein
MEAEMRFKHHNDCPCCPIIGAEDIDGDEHYRFLALDIDVSKARKLTAGRETCLLSKDQIRAALTFNRINDAHLDHLPLSMIEQPGIVAKLPGATLLIDGSHRAARCLRDKLPFFVRVVEEHELTKVGVPEKQVKRMREAMEGK